MKIILVSLALLMAATFGGGCCPLTCLIKTGKPTATPTPDGAKPVSKAGKASDE